MRYLYAAITMGFVTLFSGDANAHCCSDDLMDQPEGKVAFSIAFHERCTREYPGTKAALDEAFVTFQRNHRADFEMVRQSSGYKKLLGLARSTFAEAEINENQCRKLVEMFLTPAGEKIRPQK